MVAGEVGRAQNYGSTPLHLAAAGGHVSVVAALLRAPGVDVNAKDSVRARFMCLRAAEVVVTGVGACAWFACVVVPRALMGTGDARWAQYERTALHLAVNGGYLLVVNLLLRARHVDVNTKDADFRVRACGVRAVGREHAPRAGTQSHGWRLAAAACAAVIVTCEARRAYRVIVLRCT